MAVFTSVYDPMDKEKKEKMEEHQELLADMLDLAIQELEEIAKDSEIYMIDQMKICDKASCFKKEDIMNYYVLFCQSLKIDKLYQVFNSKEGVEAFIPKMERYIRSKDMIVLINMFPGYLFIKTKMNQIEFDTFLLLMNEQRDGIIRELKKDEVSALTQEEIYLLDNLLDDEYLLRMSKGYKVNGKTVVIEGPLKKLEKHIVSVDKKSHEAVLNIQFLNKKLKAGIEMQNSKV